MRFIRILICNSSFRNTIRFFCVQTRISPVVKVVSLNDDDSIKLSFKISSSPLLNIKAKKNEDVSTALSQIKNKAALQRKIEEMKKRGFVIKHSPVPLETEDENINVCLIGNNKLIDDSTLNTDAWSQASVLKIGNISYEIQYNTPVVTNLTLPEYIVVGCILRPHCRLECAILQDCVFTWYRSVPNTKNSDTNNLTWIKVSEGYYYATSQDDAGCHLRVVCSPRMNNQVGPDFSTVSFSVVEAGPKVFPFEERHKYMKIISDSDEFRCVSYNTLANMYVEKQKFSYASDKARNVYYRKQLLQREILGYNSDVICLQEVQERVYDYDFSPVFKEAGFDGFYMRKGGRRYEGLATFYRSSKFRVLFNEGILLNEVVKEKDIFVDLLTKISGNYKDMSKLLVQDTALQVVLLENIKNPSNKIWIANTHLYSNKYMPEVRLMQAALCINYLEHLIKTKPIDPSGLLFCGDFNSLPNSEAYDFLMSGNFQCCSSWKNNNINTNLNEDNTLRHNLCLESACGTPVYTNYTEEFQGCLDYIFYSKNSLEVTEVVPMPSHESVTAKVGLPNENFPSDHIALICTLKWKVNDS